MSVDDQPESGKVEPEWKNMISRRTKIDQMCYREEEGLSVEAELMPLDKKSRKNLRKKIRESERHSEETAYVAEALKSLKYRNIFLAPRLPAIREKASGYCRRSRKTPIKSWSKTPIGQYAGKVLRGTYIDHSLQNENGRWTRCISWSGNKDLLAAPIARRIPKWVTDGDKHMPPIQTADPPNRRVKRLLSRESTADEQFYHEQIKAGYYPECATASTFTRAIAPHPDDVAEEELTFGGVHNLGFPTERRPSEYRREMKTQISSDDLEWIQKFPLIGPKAQTPQELETAQRLMATWRDIFVDNIREMPQTDLIQHRIPTYRNAKPIVSKPVLYTPEEKEWQRKNLPKLIEAGIIAQVSSPWCARSRFPRKENGDLRMVQAFCALNNATIKANVPMRRLEPVLVNLGQPWLKMWFKCDAANGYWAIGVFPAHAYKLGFASSAGQFCYLRMGQGCTGGPGTYTQLKDITTGYIPSPNEEPPLAEVMKGRATFDHFVDDDIGGAATFDDMIEFLHNHYFPRLAWAKLTLNPTKCTFFVDSVKILGHQLSDAGIRPSDKKLEAFKEWPIPQDKDQLMRFLNTLPFLKAFIPGRADYAAFLKTAIVEERVTTKREGKQKTTKTIVDFQWTSKHTAIFEEIKLAVLTNACSGGDVTKQYHLTTDASKTGAGGVLLQLKEAPPGTVLNEKVHDQVQIVMFLSTMFTETQRRYHTTEREALAVLEGLKETRWLVLGSPYPVMLYTDHSALLRCLKSEDVTGRIARWQLSLSEFDLEIFHVPGKSIALADGLSRFNGPPAVETDGVENPMMSFIAELCAPRRVAEGMTTTGELMTADHPFPAPAACLTMTADHPVMTGKEAPQSSKIKEVYTENTAEGEEPETENFDATMMAFWRPYIEDDYYGPIIEYLIAGAYMTEGVLAQAASRIIKRRAARFRLVEVTEDEGVLAYVEKGGKISRCLLSAEVPFALHGLHNLHGHFSYDITLQRCINVYYWPSRAKDVALYCKSCPNCQMVTILRPRKGLTPVVAIQPMDIIGIDYIGPFTPVSKSGCKFIIMAVDYMTRFLFAEAVKEATSANTLAFVERRIVAIFGWPRACYNDNGSHFHGKFEEALKKQKVTQTFAPITWPSSVGLAERYVRLILTVFRTVLQDHYSYIFEWDTFLQAVLNSINSRFIKVFGYSPAELMIGFNPRYEKGGDDFEDILRSDSINAQVKDLIIKEGMTVEEANYESRLAKLDELRDRALSRRYEMAEKQAQDTEKPEPKVAVKEGTIVRLRRLGQENQKSHKLEPRNEGLYKVTKVAHHGQSAWIADLTSGKVKGRFHMNAMSPFLKATQFRPDAAWENIVEMNKKQRKLVNEYIRKRKEEKKEKIRNQNPADQEDQVPNDQVDNKFVRQVTDQADNEVYGDEPSEFWKFKRFSWERVMTAKPSDSVGVGYLIRFPHRHEKDENWLQTSIRKYTHPGEDDTPAEPGWESQRVQQQ